MKFTTDVSNLKKALSIIKPAIPKKSDMAILYGVCLELRKKELTLCAFNLQQGIKTRIEVESDSAEDVCGAIVDFNLLSSILSKLDGEITLVRNEDPQLLITHSLGEYNLSVSDLEEYPVLPSFEEKGIELNWKEIKPILDIAKEAASTNPAKQILTGIHFKPIEDTNVTEIAATDGHRLIKGMYNGLVVNEPVTISRDIIEASLTAFRDKYITLSVSGSLVKFESEETSLIGYTVTGDYPRYEALIPDKFAHEMLINGSDFKKYLSLTSPLQEKVTPLVKLDITSDNIKLSSLVPDVGNVEVDYKVDVGPTEEVLLAFNYKYLLGAVSAFTEECSLCINEPNHPVILSSSDIKYLIMPVMRTS